MRFFLRSLLSTFATVLILAGCSSISVNSDFDTTKDFAALKTYAWMEPKKKIIVDPLVDNDLMSRRIARSVDAELQKLGYTKAQGSEGADFLVTYHVSSEDKISVSTFHSSFGYYPCWQGCYGYGYGPATDVHVRQYKEGTFMLDIIEPASQELMWRGVAGQRLNSGTPQERDDYVRAIVGAILAKFPPK